MRYSDKIREIGGKDLRGLSNRIGFGYACTTGVFQTGSRISDTEPTELSSKFAIYGGVSSPAQILGGPFQILGGVGSRALILGCSSSTQEGLIGCIGDFLPEASDFSSRRSSRVTIQASVFCRLCIISYASFSFSAKEALPSSNTEFNT